MILTTTPTMQGKSIDEYMGIVTGEAIIGANLVKDLFAQITDVVGGRSAAYEGALQEARGLALRGLVEDARTRGANAVIGVDLDYEVLGSKNGMLMVCASGTAVKISDA